MKIKTNRHLFYQLSIQQRLPLLICTLLLSAITIYGFANYYSLKKATLIIGENRLSSLTDQMSTMFGQSSEGLLNIGNSTATQSTLIQCLKSNGNKFRKETIGALNKLHRDSNWVSTTLVNASMAPVLRSDNSTRELKINLKSVIQYDNVSSNSSRVGKLYNINGTMYYPVIIVVNEEKQIIGYIISWVMVNTSQKTVTQFSKLMGTGAGFYIVNTDGSLWTNLVKPIKAKPVAINTKGKIMEYTDADGRLLMASAKIIPGTAWIIMIEFPEDKLLASLSTFVKWIFGIGLVLMAVGIFAAWIMSRNITKPLNRLTIAATAISKGNYSISEPITLPKNDELGKLANAFNFMATQVHQMHQSLENKVEERTAQLEAANKELEAFSYSVSHDLRTPLRAINGYSIMLKEDYESGLDQEGKRILGNIITNARMMGQLIDDLLSFSRLGKKELAKTLVNMQLLVAAVVEDLLQNEPENKYYVVTGTLPPVEADQVMIKQVVVNLISNAIKYSSKIAGPEIEIGAINEDTNTVYYVKDNGAGFDMAYSDKLFGVFQRLHSQEEFEGTGVGLALAKRIIEKHKGKIWAEGAINKGATFYFSIPKN